MLRSGALVAVRAAGVPRCSLLRSALSLVLAIAVAMPAAAHAAPPADDSGDDAAARFDRAERLYREGRYAEAVEILQALIAEYPEPILRFNLGRALESAGRLSEAIDAYEGYLDSAPDASDRADVEGRIERLHAQLEAQRLEAPQPRPVQPEPRPKPPPPQRRPIIAPWVLTGIGGAGLVVGTGFGGASRSRSKTARDPRTDQVRASALQDDARRFATVANVGLAVGGALLVAGLAWGIAAVAKRKRR